MNGGRTTRLLSRLRLRYSRPDKTWNCVKRTVMGIVLILPSAPFSISMVWELGPFAKDGRRSRLEVDAAEASVGGWEETISARGAGEDAISSRSEESPSSARARIGGTRTHGLRDSIHQDTDCPSQQSARWPRSHLHGTPFVPRRRGRGPGRRRGRSESSAGGSW
jgi:hypothetical protein